ncbi:MAG: hypothetical protein OXC61_07030 [Flavobacteriaceae bacterium]|nr:hypothetical protein [Flavobacteriaceae bacterium]
MKIDIEDFSKLPVYLFYAIILLIGVLCFIGVKNNASSLWMFMALSFVLGAIFYACQLRLQFTTDHLKYQFIPFNRRPKHIRWDDVETLEIKKARPLRNFLGWGIRYSSKYGWGYITDATYAIFITSKNKKIVISVKNKDSVLNFLKQNNIPFVVK